MYIYFLVPNNTQVEKGVTALCLLSVVQQWSKDQNDQLACWTIFLSRKKKDSKPDWATKGRNVFNSLAVKITVL